jgi:hypothetical protein
MKAADLVATLARETDMAIERLRRSRNGPNDPNVSNDPND